MPVWTALLTVTGLSGLWLVARHWQGWILYLINEVLWLAYGLTIHSTPVIVMAVLWFITGTRNLVVTRRSQHALRPTPDLPGVQPDLRDADGVGDDVARYVSVLHEYRACLDRLTDADYREFWRPYY